MKKILTILLIAGLCCASIFAADISAKVMVTASFGSDGFSLTSNDGIWNPQFATSVNGDKAGAEFAIALLDWGKRLDLKTGVWFKPDLDLRYVKEGSGDKFVFGADNLKLSAGAQTSVVSGEISSVTSYIVANYTKGLENYDVAFGFKPQMGSKDASVYVAGQVNHAYKNDQAHFDALARIDFANGKAKLVYALAEADWIFGKEEDEELPAKIIDKRDISGKFTASESVYFNRRDYTWDSCLSGQIVPMYRTSFSVAGVRYKYYADDPAKTGIYGYGWINKYTVTEDTKKTSYYEAEVEVGKTGTVLEVGYKGLQDKYWENVYARAELGYTKDDLTARFSEAYAKISSNGLSDGSTPYTILTFLNKNSSSPLYSNPGLFVKQGATFSVGICGLEPSVLLGVDPNKNFKWKTSVQSTVNY